MISKINNDAESNNNIYSEGNKIDILDKEVFDDDSPDIEIIRDKDTGKEFLVFIKGDKIEVVDR